MTILQEAANLTSGDRNADYGHPHHDWTVAGQLWSLVIGVPVTAKQACLCMALMKIRREINKPKRDNIVDACGYLRCYEMIQEHEAANPVTTKQTLIYLAAPYRHNNPAVVEWRVEQINRKCAELMAAGHLVFSPISHSHPIAMQGNLPKNWAFWENYDRVMLSKCDELLVLKLPGWETSEGVQAEIRIAEGLGLTISFCHYVEFPKK